MDKKKIREKEVFMAFLAHNILQFSRKFNSSLRSDAQNHLFKCKADVRKIIVRISSEFSPLPLFAGFPPPRFSSTNIDKKSIQMCYITHYFFLVLHFFTPIFLIPQILVNCRICPPPKKIGCFFGLFGVVGIGGWC